MKNSVVNIESANNNSFGTGFVIDKDEKGVYILTCQHVIEDVGVPVIESVLARVTVLGGFLDMAVIYVPKLDLKPLPLAEQQNGSSDVMVIGFSRFNHEITQKQHIEATLYKESVELHSKKNDDVYTVRKIKAKDGFTFNRGNSGSPVICQTSGKVIAMVSNKEGNSLAYAINIENLKDVWTDIPKNILNIDKEKITNDKPITLISENEDTKPLSLSSTDVKKEKNKFFIFLKYIVGIGLVLSLIGYFLNKNMDNLGVKTEELRKERIEQAKIENERVAKREKIKKEKIEAERVEQERIVKRDKEKKERIEEERVEQARIEKERIVKRERIKKERIEEERLEQERIEKRDKARKKRLEEERVEEVRLEKERVAKRERIKKERIEEERLEQERIEKRNKERKKRIEKERSYNERSERIEKERERAEKERIEKRDREINERIEKEKIKSEKFAENFVKDIVDNISAEIEKIESNPNYRLDFGGGNYYIGFVKSFGTDGLYPQGKGIIHTLDGNKLKGFYTKGELNGEGTLVYLNGAKFIGQFKNGLQEGEGVLTDNLGTELKGYFINYVINGEGSLLSLRGDTYKGSMKNNIQHGYGVEKHPSGDRYEGMFKHGKYNGKGTLFYPTGGRYEGIFMNGMKHGYGVDTYPNGTTQSGTYINGVLSY